MYYTGLVFNFHDKPTASVYIHVAKLITCTVKGWPERWLAYVGTHVHVHEHVHVHCVHVHVLSYAGVSMYIVCV